jgi:hypothetical protein
MQDMIQEFGCVVSSNHQSIVSVDNVYNYFNVLNYPKTSAISVAHFVHFLSLLIQDRDLKAEVQKAINQQMSKVCIAYTRCILNLTYYKFNSHSIVIT